MRTRRDSLIKYVITYIILVSSTLLLLLWRPMGIYMITILMVPTFALVTVILASTFVKRRNEALSDVLRGLVAPSLFVYLMISGLTPILVSSHRVYSLVISYLMNFLVFTVIGALTNWYSGRRTIEGSRMELLMKYLSYFFIFLGLGYLFGAAYSPLFYPFMAISIVYLAIAPVSMVKDRNGDLGSIIVNSRSLAMAAFGVGLLYSILSIPKPPVWNTYILITFVLVASIAIVYAGYRLYTSGLSALEGIEEELYEAHRREVRVVASPEYALFEEAVKEFITNGKKDKLIAYLVHELTNDGLDYEDIINRLDRLIKYSSVTTCGRRINRRVLELEVRNRINLVNELMSELLSDKNT